MKIQTADFIDSAYRHFLMGIIKVISLWSGLIPNPTVDYQRESMLCSLDSTKPSTVILANCHEKKKVLPREKNDLEAIRDETKPSKHRFRPSEQIRRTSWQVRLSEVASLCVSTAVFTFWSHGTAYGNEISHEPQFETRRDLLTLLASLAKRYVY